jgi:hypothetical protein
MGVGLRSDGVGQFSNAVPERRMVRCCTPCSGVGPQSVAPLSCFGSFILAFGEVVSQVASQKPLPANEVEEACGRRQHSAASAPPARRQLSSHLSFRLSCFGDRLLCCVACMRPPSLASPAPATQAT